MQIGDTVWVEVSRDRERLGEITQVDLSPDTNLPYEVRIETTGLLLWSMSSKIRPATGQQKPVEGATKNDSKKNRLELIPPEAIEAMGRAFTFGATKYDADNWRKGFDWRRLIGAAQRHINSFNGGEDKDPESGLSHIAHALACLAMLSAHEQKGLGNDDRTKTTK